ncbi:DUF2189 domain-containing protein [Plasticicumulans sp.]|uniref:DUF2189 domain-containing protein n=1 Tax=Plasticicumulans sp. TaxID=2307179 RepID=UPI002CC8A5CE|nr:DUF2189 domain-containing protein [Plasticicumulans sp.]MBS0601971.1 DUF2189 domain-containing protein [Pseudomonadota bacterium]HMV38853.1 DUF2189 domain-containing protein [Plasticicumulans sp.]HMW28260.1 DUF2189 domain-containing protein [Plasticicumulans sp.]HMW40858.1 DUF2189 domain-containing protein [Plasticicumulans sp.]HMX53172.1 DUF2189 domain-containing protein [Plasticicumulans sp.]
MSQTLNALDDLPLQPQLRDLSPDRPLVWLRKGWRDTLATPVASLLYGGLFVLMGWLLIHHVAAGNLQLAFTLAWGFMLVGPFLATGFYELSRRLEAGEPAQLWHAITALRHNPAALLLLGLASTLFLVAWVRVSAVVYAIVLGGSPDMTLAQIAHSLMSVEGVVFIAFYFAIGGVLATFAFCLSVISFPMLLDRRADVITAIVASFGTAYRNRATMLRWAGWIALLTGLGFVTVIGLALTLPLIGHASWHAYRDAVDYDALPPA